jgi:uncharacterized membrane protein YfcA
MNITWLITFVLVVLLNVFYAFYLRAVQANRLVLASAWSSAINLSASVAAINYIEDHRILIPSCIGSFVGTYIGMKLSLKNKKPS